MLPTFRLQFSQSSEIQLFAPLPLKKPLHLLSHRYQEYLLRTFLHKRAAKLYKIDNKWHRKGRIQKLKKKSYLLNFISNHL